MSTAALQSGTTPEVCPYGHTNCVPTADAAAFAQLTRQLEEERAKNRQLTTRNQQLEAEQKVKDEQRMVQSKQLIVQGDQLISQSEQLRAKDERIKQLSEQTASPAKRAKQQGRRTDVKKSKVETSFIPWNGAGNACFVLDGARVKFWNGDALTDLKLRNNSKTHKFLPMLSGGALSKAEVKKEICTQKTSPYDAVRDVNRLLNGKIKKLNIKKVPQDTAFVACDKRTGHYYSTLPIKSFQEFDLS